jgi:hypothetical protein
MIRGTSIAMSLLITACACSVNGTVAVFIGDKKYEFPAHRVVSKAQRPIRKADTYGPTLLNWTRDEVSAAIPNFVDGAEGVTYRFDVQVNPSFDSKSGPRLDSYLLRGDFQGGLVQFDQATGLYRVHRRIDRDRWDLLSVAPNPQDVSASNIPSSGLWIGDCARPVGFKHVLCQIETKYQAGSISVNVLAENLVFRDQLMMFVRKELDSAQEKSEKN